jgi:methionyl aminopeptidase
MEYPFKKDKRGMFTDMAVTVEVGKVDDRVQELISVTKNSLKLAINKVKPGNTLNDIGLAVEEFVNKAGFSVVRDLVGHGVGKAVHEDPQVPNYKIVDSSMKNYTLKPGMTIAIEPMVNMGTCEIETADDGFTFVTEDKGLSAHFEHTVAVTEEGCVVLTEL